MKVDFLLIELMYVKYEKTASVYIANIYVYIANVHVRKLEDSICSVPLGNIKMVKTK